MVRQGSRRTFSRSHVCLQCRRNDAAVWVADGDRIKGKWIEVIADRASHKFTGRAEISYDVKVMPTPLPERLPQAHMTSPAL
jgi:hypothetical protein